MKAQSVIKDIDFNNGSPILAPIVINDPLRLPLFEMRLEELYRADAGLRYEISVRDFIALFPVHYKNGNPIKPEHPATTGIDREVFLKVLVAFNQCFK